MLEVDATGVGIANDPQVAQAPSASLHAAFGGTVNNCNVLRYGAACVP